MYHLYMLLVLPLSHHAAVMHASDNFSIFWKRISSREAFFPLHFFSFLSVHVLTSITFELHETTAVGTCNGERFASA
jgi:hypothetical protein